MEILVRLHLSDDVCAIVMIHKCMFVQPPHGVNVVFIPRNVQAHSWNLPLRMCYQFGMYQIFNFRHLSTAKYYRLDIRLPVDKLVSLNDLVVDSRIDYSSTDFHTVISDCQHPLVSFPNTGNGRCIRSRCIINI